MWYKKFCRVWIGIFLLFSFFFPLMAIFIDPYNVFHWDNVRYNGIEPNKNYIKTNYILHNPNKYNSYLFGSSRVGVIHCEKINDVKVYNMTYSEGIPIEHFWNIQTFFENNVAIKRIYIGIDDILLYALAENHKTQHLRSQYEFIDKNYMQFLKMYMFNLRMLASSLLRYKFTGTSSDVKQMYKNGWWGDYNLKSKYDWTNVQNILRTKTVVNKKIM